ncbi:hypothetical protein AAC387_Pa11g0940 [Persea americana]
MFTTPRPQWAGSGVPGFMTRVWRPIRWGLTRPCHNAAEEDGDPREFPGHEEAYIDGFATHHLLLDLVRFRSQCIRVGPGGKRRDERVVDWKKSTATTRDSSEETTKSDVFEAVVICDGYDTGGG